MIDFQVAFEPPAFDFDNDGQTEQMRFVITDNIRFSHDTRTGFILGGTGSTLVDIVSDLYEDLTGEELPSDGRRQNLFLDLGGGTHVTDVEGQVVDGSDNQWGTGDGGEWDKTGEHPIHQIQLLDRVLQLAEIDSRPPDGNYPNGHTGTLEIGLYEGDTGVFQSMNVVVEEPGLSFDADQESGTATVSINFVEAVQLGGGDDETREDVS